jgi:hypothetical protein
VTVIGPPVPLVIPVTTVIGPIASRVASRAYRLRRRVRPVPPALRGWRLASLLGGGLAGCVTIGGRQRVGPNWAELAQPLFSGKIGSIVRLLAVVPPPAHRYLHTPNTAKIARTPNSLQRAP